MLWRETPLLYSKHLSDRLGSEYAVYLKLENLQPAHSFKSRGVSHFIRRQLEIHGSQLHAICASGGNAGLAAAAASQALGVKCTIYLPEGVDSGTHHYLAALEAEVIVGGTVYGEALLAAENAVANEENAVLVPAYEDEIIWEGHSTMIAEVHAQLEQAPDAIFCSVGGGGLLGGVLMGCYTVGWDRVPIFALETHGSNCFFESIAANEGDIPAAPDNVTIRTDDFHGVKVARLHKLTSKATSLGASEASAGVVKMALSHAGGVKSITIPDQMSMRTVKSFADDHKMLVELACATALAPAYAPGLMQTLVPPVPNRSRVIVIIVCGGFKISADDLAVYAEVVGQDMSTAWTVRLGGGREVHMAKW
ncbi:tryptophan synthase beta subunit-like PLP-dependent enzyme [Vararia minispora EC-137]|uniref:Tryptophan synthase beta subunit-like PLP-dependent enzyme n=1 Tax=Vararia minispora EC-137 TaxID=1314806 RepID=A0ACB8QMZ1_9AGAM|nr:tryptophan synthase beta subunit-like PLP-dependent enzyme [Vararia minispora EC-137]